MSSGINRLSNLVNSLPGARQRQAESDYTVRLQETIRQQQAEIDRLTEDNLMHVNKLIGITEQRDKYLQALTTAYGFMWMMKLDKSTFDGLLKSQARCAIKSVLTNKEKKCGIASAISIHPQSVYEAEIEAGK